MATRGRNGPQRVDAKSREAAGIADLLAGKSYALIAKKHGVSKRTVRRWAEDPAVRAAIASAKEEALEELQRVGQRASQEVARLLGSKDERVRLETLKLVFDRIGVVKTDRHEIDVDAPKTEAEARAKVAALAAALGLRVVSEEGDDGQD